jgi:hypothetical protein
LAATLARIQTTARQVLVALDASVAKKRREPLAMLIAE